MNLFFDHSYSYSLGRMMDFLKSPLKPSHFKGKCDKLQIMSYMRLESPTSLVWSTPVTNSTEWMGWMNLSFAASYLTHFVCFVSFLGILYASYLFLFLIWIGDKHSLQKYPNNKMKIIHFYPYVRIFLKFNLIIFIIIKTN